MIALCWAGDFVALAFLLCLFVSLKGECLPRVSSKSVLQECLPIVSHKSFSRSVFRNVCLSVCFVCLLWSYFCCCCFAAATAAVVAVVVTNSTVFGVPLLVDEGYSHWGRWSQCNVTCGNGTEVRQRLCNNPRPYYGGKTCIGPDRETRTCKTSTTCQEDGKRYYYPCFSLNFIDFY